MPCLLRVSPVLLLGLLLVGCPRTAPSTSGRTVAPGDVIVEAFSDEELVGLLVNLGYEARLVDAGSVTFALGPGQVLLFNQWEGDLQLYYVMTGGDWEHEAINTWNRTRRLSRAYLDEESDLVLEADLLAIAGLTERQVGSFVAVFGRALELFLTEVVRGGVREAEETSPATPDGWH